MLKATQLAESAVRLRFAAVLFGRRSTSHSCFGWVQVRDTGVLATTLSVTLDGVTGRAWQLVELLAAAAAALYVAKVQHVTLSVTSDCVANWHVTRHVMRHVSN